MKDYLAIKDINAIEVFDSRGNPTIQVEIITDGGFSGTAIVPSGASTGNYEAIELRDNNIKRLNGKGVQNAVKNVNKKIRKALINMNVYEQRKIDDKLIELDGTENKENLGANATLGVSLAVAKAASNSLGMELYNYIGGINSDVMPRPMMNILNGGKHSENNLNIQEFMIVPIIGNNFRSKLEIGIEVYNALKNILKERKYTTAVGDEGGFAPSLNKEEDAIELIMEATDLAGFVPGKEVGIAIDIAATEMWNEAKKQGKEGYCFWKTKLFKTKDEMINYIIELYNRYPLISIEDPLAEEDWESWEKLTEKIGDKIQIVGDDLFVTNIKRLKKGINKNAANAILIKPNQIGTLSETLDCIKVAKENGYKIIVSHRSGETEDTTIADIAVGINAGQIKIGAPCRTDRVAKYNRLLNIEEEIK